MKTEAQRFRAFADSTYLGDAVVLVACAKCHIALGEHRERVNRFNEWAFKPLSSFERRLFNNARYIGQAAAYCDTCYPK